MCVEEYAGQRQVPPCSCCARMLSEVEMFDWRPEEQGIQVGEALGSERVREVGREGKGLVWARNRREAQCGQRWVWKVVGREDGQKSCLPSGSF